MTRQLQVSAGSETLDALPSPNGDEASFLLLLFARFRRALLDHVFSRASTKNGFSDVVKDSEAIAVHETSSTPRNISPNFACTLWIGCPGNACTSVFLGGIQEYNACLDATDEILATVCSMLINVELEGGVCGLTSGRRVSVNDQAIAQRRVCPCTNSVIA